MDGLICILQLLHRVRSKVGAVKLIATCMNRNIYYSHARMPGNLPDDLELPPPHFTCAVFLHSVDWDKARLANLLERLIEGGCVYFAFHGNRCEEAHDLADEVALQNEAYNLDENPDSVIMTTWHENESINDVLSDFLQSAWPAADYDSTFSSCVILSFGTAEDDTNIQALLANPETIIENSALEE